MPRLHDTQSHFATAVHDPESALPPGLLGRAGEVPTARFGVYRNNVGSSLVDAVAANYPTIQRLVGTEFLRAMVQVYVRDTLPETPVLIHYGATFPGFVAAFEPAQRLPYLADVARIDWAWHQAYHAAEANPLGPEQLATIPADELAGRRMLLHPSAGALSSPWPALSIWHTNRHDATVKPVDLRSGGQDTLICRPAHEVGVWHLPAGGAGFLHALAGQATLSDAARQSAELTPAFDLTRTLQALLASGAITGIR
ncbi:MAG: DUF2063 domain-containing protein [Thioalkalivibrio sp.]|nr:MAG: DUF2063 domain-containing protein [Thioalkalivibrio sp.]